MYAGYGVCDPKGEEIGEVKVIFVNEGHKPEYARVKMGFFGLKSALIPIQSVSVDGERRKLVLE